MQAENVTKGKHAEETKHDRWHSCQCLGRKVNDRYQPPLASIFNQVDGGCQSYREQKQFRQDENIKAIEQFRSNAYITHAVKGRIDEIGNPPEYKEDKGSNKH